MPLCHPPPLPLPAPPPTPGNPRDAAEGEDRLPPVALGGGSASAGGNESPMDRAAPKADAAAKGGRPTDSEEEGEV